MEAVRSVCEGFAPQWEPSERTALRGENEAASDAIARRYVRRAQTLAERCVTRGPQPPRTLTDRLDRVFLHRIFGYGVLLLLLLGVFWLTIEAANYPSALLQAGFDRLGLWLRRLCAGLPPWLHGALLDGIYATAARVIAVMLPPMAIFFPLFTLLEDFGYLPRVAFLLDEETFAEKVDSRLTILNGYLAGNAKRFDASKNYKEDVTLSGTVKVIDSIKGDRSYPYSGKASVLLGKDGMSMSLSADLGKLAELLEGLGGKLPEAYRALTVKPELEAIFSDKLYFRSPLLDAAMAKANAPQAVSGAWYATDAVMSFPDLYRSMYGGNEDYTVGKALYAAMKQGDANRFYEGWSGTDQLAAAAVELFGDETFTKSGSGYKWHFGKEELAMLLAEAIPGFIADSGVEELSIDLTMRSDGGVELKYTASTSINEEAALRIDYTLAGNSSRMTAKGTVQVRNVCDVTFDAAVSVRATSEKPLTAPPAGATIITLPPVMPIAA